jgi:hypothetical protein
VELTAQHSGSGKTELVNVLNLLLLECLWLCSVVLLDNRLLDLAFYDDLCLLIGELNPFTLRVMIERCLLIPVFLLLFFFQIESHIDCSFFWFCSNSRFLFISFCQFLISSFLQLPTGYSKAYVYSVTM